MKVIHKTYIDNSRFMEFIDEMATQITEMNFGQETYEDGNGGFTEEAEDYYNEMYDEYEMMANNIMGVYSDSDEKK